MEQTPHPKILVLSRRKPHLIFLMGLSVLTGLNFAFSGPGAAAIPTWMQRGWAITLGLTGLVALVAHLQRWDRERGMFFERGALIIQSTAVMAYTLALPSYIGLGAGSVITILAGLWWAATNFWEVRLIGKDLKLIDAAHTLKGRLDNAAD